MVDLRRRAARPGARPGRRRAGIGAVSVVAVLLLVAGLAGLAGLTQAHRGRPSGSSIPTAPGGVASRLPDSGALGGGPDRSRKVGSAIAAGRLLFVGASYSVGWGATARDDRYEDVVARRLHRRFSVDAVAGTGFLDPGPHHEGTFAQRLRRIPPRVDPRIVVLQGGRDDVGYPPAREYRAAVRTIRLAQHRFRHAQVVVLGPIPARVPVPRAERAINASLVRASRTARAGYVDAIAQGWIDRDDEEGYLGRLRDHPDDAGYAYIARRLVADLPSALSASRPPLDPRDEPAAGGRRPVS